jgi:hypothetical protein
MNRITQNPTDTRRDDELARIAAALERLERRLDDFFGAYLDAKFPFGRPVDRWRRRGAA